MPNISIKSQSEANPVTDPDVYSGASGSLAYFDGDSDPLHLYLHEVVPGDTLAIARSDIDRLAYVWRGDVSAEGVPLTAGSSLIVEHGRELQVDGGAQTSLVLTFAAANPRAEGKEGGNIHLLPADRVPRAEMREGLKGGMHADSACPTCSVWLHENRFPGQQQPLEKAEKGIHAHSEDEIIFVTEGEIRFGNRIGGPGTALAIAADTFYSFLPGPEGLAFVNFRASMPTDIRFKSGGTMSETGYWRELVSRPEYLAV